MPELSIFSPIDSRIFVWKITETLSRLLDIAGKNISDWQKYKTEIHQKQFLVKNILLRKLHLESTISYRDNGKPFLPDGQYISISHSKNFVGIALSNRPVGIDLEFAQTKLIAVAPKYIHQSEQNLIDINNSQQLLYFWTAKESIYKLIGEKGLHFRRDIQIRTIDFVRQTGTAIVRNEKKINLYFNPLENNFLICQAIYDESVI